MLKLAILNSRQYGIKESDLLRASVVGLRLDVATVVKQEPTLIINWLYYLQNY